MTAARGEDLSRFPHRHDFLMVVGRPMRIGAGVVSEPVLATERSDWDNVLRALIWQAADAKEAGDDQAYTRALHEIVDTHARWPLVEYAIELRYARMVERRRRVWLADSVALMRDTYPDVQREREAA